MKIVDMKETYGGDSCRAPNPNFYMDERHRRCADESLARLSLRQSFHFHWHFRLITLCLNECVHLSG